ncbi:S8 family peptidase [Bacillus marinisedimentorum]|uniref:S8 family peptidase n=1 Tax=Bacillus marinisedimentorum TaxID=1821260 RepID=UPI0007DE88CD|nr:S8 family peptidase [Bacillus marinisedimentorum]
MFGFSMIKMVRQHAHRLDLELRKKLIDMYRPFHWTPCVLHRSLEGFLKRTKKISVIVEFNDEKAAYASGLQTVEHICKKNFRSKVLKHFPAVHSCSCQVTSAALEEFMECGHIRKVFLNREVRALLDVAVFSANAREINQARNLTGAGTTIAVIDTGIHPHKDISSRIIAFKDLVNGRDGIENAYDDNGHGTHCAGDAAASGNFAGPAYKANLVGVKVLDKHGSGSLDTVMEGVQWCMDFNRFSTDERIDIISLSLGSTAMPGEDPMVKIVEKAWEEGIVIYAAAGNSGPDYETIASPGTSEMILTVGASDDRNSILRTDDVAASFSSRGPTINGASKPDLLSPGVNIISLRSPGSYLDKLQKQARVGTGYMSLSGTSMATPLCAGVTALLLEYLHSQGITADSFNSKRELPDLIKDSIKNGADNPTPVVIDPYIHGAGFLNAEKSLEWLANNLPQSPDDQDI